MAAAGADSLHTSGDPTQVSFVGFVSPNRVRVGTFRGGGVFSETGWSPLFCETNPIR
jgi:hypothetical protein